MTHSVPRVPAAPCTERGPLMRDRPPLAFPVSLGTPWPLALGRLCQGMHAAPQHPATCICLAQQHPSTCVCLAQTLCSSPPSTHPPR